MACQNVPADAWPLDMAVGGPAFEVVVLAELPGFGAGGDVFVVAETVGADVKAVPAVGGEEASVARSYAAVDAVVVDEAGAVGIA